MVLLAVMREQFERHTAVKRTCGFIVEGGG
jgi:hypothetical protein